MSNNNYPSYPPNTPGPGYMPPQDPFASAAPHGSGNFIEHLHNVGKSGMFLAGIIMFSAGTTFSLLVGFTWYTIFQLLVAALPITGFWLIFAASKTPKLPEKTLPALTLFKAYAIIGLVITSLILLFVFVILVIALIFATAYGDSFDVAVLFFLLFLLTIIPVIIIVFYYVPFLKVLSSIRENIVNNTMNRIRGVTSFTVMTVIYVVLGIIGSLILILFLGAMGFLIEEFIDDIMWYVWMYAPELAGFGIPELIMGAMAYLAIAILLSMITYIGIILIIVSLNRVAGSVRR